MKIKQARFKIANKSTFLFIDIPTCGCMLRFCRCTKIRQFLSG